MRRRNKSYRQYCAALAGLPCLHGPTTPHRRCEIMGPVAPISLAVARANVNQFVAGTALEREALALYIARTGHAILHASHEMHSTSVCHCAACSDPTDPRHPWLRDSAHIAGESRSFKTYPIGSELHIALDAAFATLANLRTST